jgi:hypothetical protein
MFDRLKNLWRSRDARRAERAQMSAEHNKDKADREAERAATEGAHAAASIRNIVPPGGGAG